jgi:hypothetical protein
VDCQRQESAERFRSVQPTSAGHAPAYFAAHRTAHHGHKVGRQISHWYNSAESYSNIGDASAKAMIELVK